MGLLSITIFQVQLVGAAQAIGRQVQSVIESELQRILLALQHCWTRDHRKMIIEGDNN